jgi:hypothetical protein
MPNRALIYLFPFILTILEWLLRKGLQTDSSEFVAPTIAAAALGLLISLTGIRRKDDAVSKMTLSLLGAIDMELTPKRQRILVEIVWIVFFFSLVIWVGCLVFECRPAANPWRVSPFWWSMGSYFVAVIFSELKEIV